MAIAQTLGEYEEATEIRTTDLFAQLETLDVLFEHSTRQTLLDRGDLFR